VCIDRYEFPNRKGVLPETAVDEEAAAARCRAVGKRLCTRREFTAACESRRGWLFAYGRRFRQDVCNTAGPKGERRPPEPSGARPKCRTRSGIYDLNGNLAEWVSGGVLMGGSAAKPGPQTSCEADTGSGGTAYNGFRCCIRPRRR
jgi:formylglycine-generating enzyme required for sulfatase activity